MSRESRKERLRRDMSFLDTDMPHRPWSPRGRRLALGALASVLVVGIAFCADLGDRLGEAAPTDEQVEAIFGKVAAPVSPDTRAPRTNESGYLTMLKESAVARLGVGSPVAQERVSAE